MTSRDYPDRAMRAGAAPPRPAAPTVGPNYLTRAIQERRKRLRLKPQSPEKD